ncbi:MAG: hypothetical protein ACI9D8_001513, partial [Reinekea sp.]
MNSSYTNSNTNNNKEYLMTKLSAISAAVLFSMTGGYAMHALAGDVVIESWRT